MKRLLETCKLGLKAIYSIIAVNLKYTWKHFTNSAKDFFKGHPLKMLVDLTIALIIAIVFPPLAIAFASFNFTGAPHPVLNVTIAVTTAVVLSVFSSYIMEVVVVLAAMFVSQLTWDVIKDVQRLRRQNQPVKI